MKVHVVRPGEFLTQIAWRYGLDEKTIWDHPKNKELRELRPNPNVLAPGDLITIPDVAPEPQAIDLETSNTFEAAVPLTTITVALRDDKEPLASQPFVVEGLDKPFEGTTDGAGNAVFSVPVYTRQVELVLPKMHRRLRLEIGGLDPLDERSGVIARLNHLGYLRPETILKAKREGKNPIEAALLQFQQSHGLDETGQLDEDTQKALADRHGS